MEDISKENELVLAVLQNGLELHKEYIFMSPTEHIVTDNVINKLKSIGIELLETRTKLQKSKFPNVIAPAIMYFKDTDLIYLFKINKGFRNLILKKLNLD